MQIPRAVHATLIPLIVLTASITAWPSFDRGDADLAGTVDTHEDTPEGAEHAGEPALPLDRPALSTALTHADREVVEWATSRFSLVGLELPPVEISFHDATEPCGGSYGVYEGNEHGSRIRVCIRDRGTFSSTLERRRTLVHELAHAWEQANLDDHERDQLLGHLGADAWYAPEAAWKHRGAERFAETIVWGLYDQLRRPILIDVPCRELHSNFRRITGVGAPGPIRPSCELAGTPATTTRAPVGAPPAA